MIRTFEKCARGDSFKILSATKHIGLPLECIPIRMMSNSGQAALMGDNINFENKTVRILSTDFKPTSPAFGQPKRKARGQCLIGSVNGDDLSVEDLEAAETFIDGVLKEWYDIEASAVPG